MSIACRKLVFGDKVSVIAPSSPSSKEDTNKALETLKALKFDYKIYDHLYDDLGYLAGVDAHRAEDFNSALRDKETKAIMCLRGGYGTMRMMDLVDWGAFRKNPKIFMGFSDITPILNYIFKKFNVITFHSPMLTSDLTNECSRESLINSITLPRSNYFIENPDEFEMLSFSVGKDIAVGNIVGGNLSLICSTISTKYEIPFKNNLLFIEEINESPYKIDRMLTHLYLSGKIQKCSGIILGQFTNCSDDNGVHINDVLMEKLKLFRKPCIYGVCAGHGEPRLTIPIGARGKIDTKNRTIEILKNIVV